MRHPDVATDVPPHSSPLGVGNGSPGASQPLLSVTDLRVHFASKRGLVHAVDGVTLDIHEGETLGLVGETGSGKSVTAKSLLRLVPTPPGIYAGGDVLFRPRNSSGESVDLLRIPERQLRDIRGNRIAMIFQDPAKALNPALSVRQQLAEVFAEHRSSDLLSGAKLAGTGPPGAGPLMSRAAHRRSTFLERRLLALPPLRGLDKRLQRELDERIATALAATRIPNPAKVMNCYPHELSGGMKQRVMIAQGLACNPDLLIADEPTTALDVTIQARILDLIQELQEQHHAAVLYISHDLSLVKRISDRVAVMYAGKLVETASTARLFEDPLHPYTRALLAAVPTADQARGELAAIEGTVPELVDPEPCCRFHTRCPHAGPICSAREPLLLARDHEQHRAACFLYDDPQDVGSPRDLMPQRQEDEGR
ncbi:MAG: ABC transporter ATP-binding protein [Actinomycetota bacterium]